MTLSVSVFVLDENGKMKFVDTPDFIRPFAGFESWRTEVWGNEAMSALGARFFPVLADGNLFVMPDQVPDFLRETHRVRAYMDDIVPEPPEPRTREWYLESISERLVNIQIAAAMALGLGGGVVVW
jgi:hypothetical protein